MMLKKRIYFIIPLLIFVSSCGFLSNRYYVQQYPLNRGIKRVAIFVQRWPVYLQLPNQNELGEGFVGLNTPFWGPWEPAKRISPRALDVKDIDDPLVGELLRQILEKKGYQPFLAGGLPSAGKPLTVKEIMANYQVMDSRVDAFLFCYYAPTLYFADAKKMPADHIKRSYSLGEISQILNPGAGAVIWAGPRAAQAPDDSISHAFIFLAITCFKAYNWSTLWEVADSHTGGEFRPWIPECLPASTDADYLATPEIIQNLMGQNLNCRLRHIIPDAF